MASVRFKKHYSPHHNIECRCLQTMVYDDLTICFGNGGSTQLFGTTKLSSRRTGAVVLLPELNECKIASSNKPSSRSMGGLLTSNVGCRMSLLPEHGL